MKKSWWGMFLGVAFLLAAAGCGGGGGGGGGNPDRFTVGGTVSGLTEGSSIVLQLNGADDLIVAGDPDGIVTFAFPNELETGDEYAVTVETPPAGVGHFWSVANASGTIAGASVTDVRVNGQLDGTFGENLDGIVTSNGAAGFTGADIGRAMAMDGDGNILVVGESERASGNSDMTIWRYDATGALDESFGDGGTATCNGDENRDDTGYAIALDGSGNILVAGMIDDGDMALWRYTPDGDPDYTFGGGDGFATYAELDPLYSSEGMSVLIDASGRILVAGSRWDGEDTDMVIWRYAESGAIDLTFGTGGTAVFSGSSSLSGDFVGNSLVLADPADENSAILVAGTVSSGTTARMAVWKYSATGTPDNLFGGYDAITDGVLVYSGASGSNHAGFSMKLAGSDILVAGYIRNPSSLADMAIWRFTGSGGSLVNTFGTAGVVTHDSAAGGNGDDQGFFITLDGDGSILVTGKSQNAADGYAMAIWKYTGYGARISSFGLNGVLVDNSAAGGDYLAAGTCLAVDAGGRVLVTGCSTNTANDLDMVIWRYFP